MVLTSSGEILTNNHVIRGATEIKVVVPKTGQSYTAKVVGYDVPHDVAVLQASGASNLKTISLGDSGIVNAGQSVRRSETPVAPARSRFASGTVTNVDRAITVSDDQGGSESLSGLIETNAAVRPGDSGGPLLNSSGQVIGMDTAASVGNGVAQTTTNDGYAIPINNAIVDRQADRERQRLGDRPHRRHGVPRSRVDREQLLGLRRGDLGGRSR